MHLHKYLLKHIEELDSTVPEGATLYRHLMSKEDDTGSAKSHSYVAGEDANYLLDILDFTQHQYITPALYKTSVLRRKNNLAATSALYVDLDDALTDIDGGRIGLDLIQYALSKTKLPEPSLIIYTGGGWHLYWIFKELYYINEPKDLSNYEEVILNIIEALKLIGADNKAHDTTRLLRLAGTRNPKPEYGDNQFTYLIECNSNNRYTLADFSNIKILKTLPDAYKPSKKATTKAKSTKQAKKSTTTERMKSERVPTTLTRPKPFPLAMVDEIITQAQSNLESKIDTAKYLKAKNKDLLTDLLVNFVNLPRNTYKFEDGSTGQYIQEGSRNHYLWSLIRRGVSPYHLSIINDTLLLPKLNRAEFNNAISLGSFNVPRISKTVKDLNLTLLEQEQMIALREDYESILDNHKATVQARITQTISESSQHYIKLSKNKTSKALADELGLTTRRVNQIKKSKEVNEVKNRQQKVSEFRFITKDIERIKDTAIRELLANYQLVDETLDSIIKNQSLIHSLGIQLTQDQKQEIHTRINSISAKVDFIQSQLDCYGSFILDESEFFKDGSIKKTVLLNKLKALKEQAEPMLA